MVFHTGIQIHTFRIKCSHMSWLQMVTSFRVFVSLVAFSFKTIIISSSSYPIQYFSKMNQNKILTHTGSEVLCTSSDGRSSWLLLHRPSLCIDPPLSSERKKESAFSVPLLPCPGEATLLCELFLFRTPEL